MAAARPLSEFLLSHLSAELDTGTAEGRARLVAEARPLLKKVAAPALQIQLTQQLAEAARMDVSDVARLAQVRLSAPVMRSVAPRPPEARLSADDKMEQLLLRAVLAQPSLALELQGWERASPSPVGLALQAIADIVEDDAGITPAALIERLRDSVHAPSVARAHGQLLDADLEADELEAEFRAALGRLRERQVAGQIDALNRTASGRELSLDEREEYKRLIREQAALKLLPQQSSNAL